MKYITLGFITFFASFSWALLKFEKGQYTIEGLVRIGEKTKNIYLLVNENTKSQVEFLLTGKEAEKLLKKEFHKALVEIKTSAAFSSSQSEAEVVSVKKVYNLGEEPKIYNSINEIPYKK